MQSFPDFGIRRTAFQALKHPKLRRCKSHAERSPVLRGIRHPATPERSILDHRTDFSRRRSRSHTSRAGRVKERGIQPTRALRNHNDPRWRPRTRLQKPEHHMLHRLIHNHHPRQMPSNRPVNITRPRSALKHPHMWLILQHRDQTTSHDRPETANHNRDRRNTIHAYSRNLAAAARRLPEDALTHTGTARACRHDPSQSPHLQLRRGRCATGLLSSR